MTVDDLQEFCASSNDTDTVACKFYILGVMEGTGLAAGVAKDTRHFCIPEGISTKEIQPIVKQAIEADLSHYKEDKDLPAVSFVAAVLVHNYPCVKK